jgi:predicted ATPase/DNA-binding XRE family transcriptional regulator
VGTDPVRSGPFAELVLRYRRAAGLSQRDLARAAGISERAVRDLERGATARPQRHSVLALGQALGLTGDALAGFVAAGRTGPLPGEVPEPGDPAFGGTGTGGTDPAGLVGRAEELRLLTDLVTAGRYRLLTLVGPGGVGKSRLAAEVAGAVRRHAVREVRVLDLSATTEPALVGELVAEVLGAGGASRLPPVERTAATLRDRPVLLVLDGFERLLAAATEVGALVRRCPGLTVLATGQVALGLRGEREIRLDPLPVPPTGLDLGALVTVPAMALLLRRAEEARPGFAATTGNAAALAAICRKVEGLPLALELAAARLRLFSPDELAHRLDRRLDVLAGGPRGVPDRHRSLRATIEWSLEVVPDGSAELFRWLGGFAGGVLLRDLEAVTGALGRDPSWLLDALAGLVDTSLLRVVEDGGGSRYVLPDAARELAAERLAAAPDAEPAARAVAVTYLRRMTEWTRQPEGPAGSVTGRDADNVRAAIAWAAAYDGTLVDQPTVRAVYRYYELNGRFTEGRHVLESLAAAGGPPAALILAGWLALLRGDGATGERLAGAALDRLDPADHFGRTSAHGLLGAAANERGDVGTSRRHLEEALADARRSGADELIAKAVNNLGSVAAEAGDFAAAADLLAESLERKRHAGAGVVDVGRTLLNLAEVSLAADRDAAAAERAREGTDLLRRGGHPRLAAVTATTLALARLRQGRTAAALDAAREAEELIGQSGEDRRTEAVVGLRCSVVRHAAGDLAGAVARLRGAVHVAADYADRDRSELALVLEWHAALAADRVPAVAATLLGAASAEREAAGRPGSAAGKAVVDGAAARCRAALGPDGYAREYRRGAALPPGALAEVCARLG